MGYAEIETFSERIPRSLLQGAFNPDLENESILVSVKNGSVSLAGTVDAYRKKMKAKCS